MFRKYCDIIIFTNACMKVFAVFAPTFSVVAQNDFCLLLLPA